MCRPIDTPSVMRDTWAESSRQHLREVIGLYRESKQWASFEITTDMPPDAMQAARDAIRHYKLDELAKELVSK